MIIGVNFLLRALKDLTKAAGFFKVFMNQRLFIKRDHNMKFNTKVRSQFLLVFIFFEAGHFLLLEASSRSPWPECSTWFWRHLATTIIISYSNFASINGRLVSHRYGDNFQNRNNFNDKFVRMGIKYNSMGLTIDYYCFIRLPARLLVTGTS